MASQSLLGFSNCLTTGNWGNEDEVDGEVAEVDAEEGNADGD